MITNFFIPELNNHDVQELWFQQDGATCHTARATIDLLKDSFGDRLFSRFGTVNWPPRSCDLTPLDYFLWGYVNVCEASWFHFFMSLQISNTSRPSKPYVMYNHFCLNVAGIIIRPLVFVTLHEVDFEA
ncbi:hypothetical protein TNCV_613471 [Trichonephila clavipes]|nr:hypothetical protein TNCV_613471 [Trichonephila clavipes]